MIYVHVYNNELEITAPNEKLKELDDIFSWYISNWAIAMRRHKKEHKVPIKGCWKCHWDWKVHFLKYNKLPIGFLDRLLSELNEDHIVYWSKKKPKKEFDWEHNIELRDYQKDAVENAIRNEVGVINIATGGGKTVVAMDIVCRLGLKTLITVPRKTILVQFIDTFKNHSNVDVGVIQGSNIEDKPVQIATIAALNKNKELVEKINREKGLIIVDEFHESAAPTWMKVLENSNAYYRFGQSATPFRKDDIGNAALESLCGITVSSIGTQQLQEEEYLSTATIKIIKVHHSVKKKKYTEMYREAIVENEDRNNIIIEKALSHQQNGDKVLILVNWKEHAEILLDRIPDVIFLSGKDTVKKLKEKTEEFSNSNKILIGTPVLDIGYDVPSINIMIIASGGAYEGRAQQRIGRGLRISEGKTGVVVYDFMDKNSQNDYTFENHSKKRIALYRKLGQKVINED